jgi:SsrA-binding protein
MEAEKLICTNRKATHDYFIEERFEAGLVLLGSEVKSLRAGRANLRDSYAGIKDNELYLYNCHISPYAEAHQFNHEPLRKRKLLLHRKQINKLLGKVTERGYTLVPLRLYFKGGKVKLELALGKGKKLFDKRGAIKEREDRREMERAIKERTYRQ